MRKNLNRKTFLQQSAILTAGAYLPALTSIANPTPGIPNALPRWQGFNLLDFFLPDPNAKRQVTTKQHFQWMQDWGFNFVRIPIAYPWYLKINHQQAITPEQTYIIDSKRVDEIIALVHDASAANLHVSLNLHRAPGYCINAGFREPFHLWTDKPAQDAFYFHWKMWAKAFKDFTPKHISFDLVNEPSMRKDLNDQHSSSGPVPGDLYKTVATGAYAAITGENPNHLVIADGNNVGNDPIPEITGLPIGQSCRGYYPGAISHYQAPWANKSPETNPIPVWPGKIGDREYNRASLESYYAPWIALKKQGTGVHCGECGCWNKTPHDVFLRWFGDLTDILTTNDIGYALWNFSGDFGLLNSNRKDVNYVDFHGEKLDRQLLLLLQKNMR